ncbi:hypothetical protein [Streptomyces sp. NPDC020330]|uniref:hypothetical protein n=1 Tax=unclassified Streptomyces TaxID=2593676 RepID=UPI0037940D08
MTGMISAVQHESAPEPRGFREVQRLAYACACAEAVAGQLRSGVTERGAARMRRAWLRERGVRDWFHLPFAWFGDRTAFRRVQGAAAGTGAKFEEILVVTDSRDPEQSAFWLDDDLPHVRRWTEERVAA